MANNFNTKTSNKGLSKDDLFGKFDILDIPYASIQPTFDYYLVSDFFPSLNNGSELDFLLEEVCFCLNFRLSIEINLFQFVGH